MNKIVIIGVAGVRSQHRGRRSVRRVSVRLLGVRQVLKRLR